MKKDLLQHIDNIYKSGILYYLLEKYVDRDYWIIKIKEYLNYYIINLTDFNYSKCHAMIIDLSGINHDITSVEYEKYLKTNTFYGIRIEISILGPYATVCYIRTQIRDQKEEFQQSDVPYLPEHQQLVPIVHQFLTEHNLSRLTEDEISQSVDGISLEMSQEHTTVYNCLFEDSSY